MSSTPVIYEYLDQAVDRVVAMLLEVSTVFTPQVQRASKYLDVKLNPPFWWVYPGAAANEALASQLDRQTFALNIRLVLGRTTTGYDGVLASQLWKWMPTVMNYFDQRKSLIYQAGQSPIKYLEAGNVRFRQISPFGPFTSYEHIGIEFQLLLPFTLSLNPVLGN